MSLTGIINHKRYKYLRKWFTYNFPHPSLGLKADILVEPTQSNYSGEIGTALDYLIRFRLDRLNQGFMVGNSRDWIAEKAYNAMLDRILLMKNPKELAIGYNGERVVDGQELSLLIMDRFGEASSAHLNYFLDGRMTKKLVGLSLFLAKLDVFYRTGIIDANIDTIDEERVEELHALYKAVPWKLFKATKHCILNPSFGKASRFVRGADADLIIDNTLIDIKSSKHLSLERRDLNQIIGYYLLSLMDGVNGKKTPKIKNIGIYYARYGVLWSLPVSHFHSNKEYLKLVEEFKQLVSDFRLDLVGDAKTKLPEKLFFDIPEYPEYTIEKDDFKCPFCSSKHFIKNGKAKSGKYRYKCKDCKKTYSTEIDTSYTSELLKNLDL